MWTLLWFRALSIKLNWIVFSVSAVAAGSVPVCHSAPWFSYSGSHREANVANSSWRVNIVLVLCSLWDKPGFMLSLHPGLHQMSYPGTHSQFASHDRLEKDKRSSGCASHVTCCLQAKQANCGLFSHSQRPSDDAPHEIQVCLNQTVIFALHKLHMVKSQWSMRFPEREM